MASRRTTLTPLLRFFAAATLMCWLAALVCCSAECLTGDSRCQPSLHDEPAADSHHDHEQAPDSDKHNDCPKAVCDSLKNFVHLTGSSFIAKAHFRLAYVAGFASPSQVFAVSAPETPIFRQAWRRNWAFTPEVFLGPAFRSLAPPVLL